MTAAARPFCRLVWSVMVLSPWYSASAGAQVDPSGRWRTWHTPHFRIHARADNERLALDAALEAERAYTLLARELAPPRGTIDLLLNDNVDFSNGFTSVFPSNRIAIFVAPPAGDPVLGPYDVWLRDVISHELTHAFHLDRTRGIWRVAQSVFGRLPGTFPNAYQPSWVAEGLAVYYESRLTTSGRLRAGFHDQLLAASAAGHWPSSGEATYLSPSWPAGFRPYAWGSQFFQWQSRTGGDSVIGRFVERTAGQLWPFATTPAMRGAGGVGVDSVWSAQRARWDSVARSGEAGAVVVRGSRVAPHPQVSPDGAALAFVEAPGRSDPRVVVRALASGRTLASHRVTGDVDLAWCGDTLYVSQLEFTDPVTVRSMLVRWIPGTSWRRVNGAQRLARPFLGPQGRVMAVDMARASSAVRAVTDAGPLDVAVPDADAWGHLATSADGSWVAGARHSSGQWDITVWKAEDPAHATTVTDDGAFDDDPAWTPDGDLLFASERSGVPQIFSYQVNSGLLMQVTNEPGGARQPAPGPDGWLFYSTLLWDGWAIARARPNPRPPAAPLPRPAFTPDSAAATTSVSVSGYSPWPALRPHFWLPTWHDIGSSGRFGGAAVAGVDPLGRTTYFGQMALASNGRFEGNLVVTHQRWKAFGIHLSLAQSWDSLRARLVTVAPNNDTVRITFGEQKRTATLGGVVQWRRWRSSVSARLDGEFEREHLAIDESPLALTLARDHSQFAGGVVSLAAQHLSFPALAISAENGIAVGGLYRYRWELGGSGWWSEVRGGASAYWGLPLPGFAHWVLATRAAVGVRDGPSADGYDLGGASGDPFLLLPGYAVGSGRRLFPLRGYPAVGTRFTRAAVAAAELRIPIALVGRALGKLPVGLNRVSLSGFAETGGGWRRGDPAVPLALSDIGGELVIDAGVPLDVPVRGRVGVAVPLVAGLGVPRYAARTYLSFGTAF